MDRIELLVPKTTPVDALAQDVYNIIDKVPDNRETPQMRYCRELVTTCLDNKSDLIDLLSKHPKWDKENYRIHFDVDYTRASDDDEASRNLMAMLSGVLRYFLRQIAKARDIYERNKTYIPDRIYRNVCYSYWVPWVGYCQRDYNPLDPDWNFYAPAPLIGLCAEDILNFRNWTDFGILTQDVCKGTRERHLDLPELAVLVGVLTNDLYFNIKRDFCNTGGITQSVVDEVKSFFPDAHITEGTKCTRAILKLLRQYGFEKLPAAVKHDALAYYSQYADNMSPLTITRHTVLSVNPVDFLLMSNGNSWKSCHYVWHKDDSNGCYRAGCESYAYDEVTMILYTVEGGTPSEELTFAPKQTRQLYFWNGSVLIGSRTYPQDTSVKSAEATRDRQLVEGIIAECLGVPNLWRKVSADDITFNSRGYHYPDYDYFEFTAHELSYDTAPHCYEFTIGSDDTICVCCGEYLDDSGYPVCTACAGAGKGQCENCGDYFDEDELTYVNGGGNWCQGCRDDYAFWCERCQEYYAENSYDHEWVHNGRYIEEVYCENCVESSIDWNEIVQCEDDAEYWNSDLAQEWTDPETGEVKYYSPNFDLSELEPLETIEEEEAA